jgi:hypothetical protein
MKQIPLTNSRKKAKIFSPDFDCELPPDVRAEFYRPKRPRILLPPSPPKSPARGNSGRSWALVVLLFALALVALASWFTKPPSSHPVTPQPVFRPTPAPAILEKAAPRAQLVPVPVRRATLYRLPTQELGVYKWYELPAEWGSGSVWARYMGTREHFPQIPRASVPGDMWNVMSPSASWILCTPSGYTHPRWIDP